MATTKKTAAAPETEKGTSWLAEVVNEKLGTSYTSYQLRILLRKLAKSGDIERGEGRWVFKGVTDPTVKAILSAVKAGALEDEKKEKLAAAKATRTAKKAAAEPKPKATQSRARKAAPEPVEEDTELDDELDDLEDL